MVNNLAIFQFINERKLSSSFMSQIDILSNDLIGIAFNQILSQIVGQQ